METIRTRNWLATVGTLAVPPAAFALLRRFPEHDHTAGSGTSHFVIVSVVAATALALALAVIWAARRVPDARTLFLALGFLSMATVFLAHGVGTGPFWQGTAPASAGTAVPSFADIYADYASSGAAAGEYAEHTSHAPAAPSASRARLQVVGFSARLSMMISAICFALAVLDLPRRLADRIVRRWGILAAGAAIVLCSYVVVALFLPRSLLWIPMGSETLGWGVAVVTWACLGFAGWRFLQAYRLAVLPLQGTMAAGMALLAEAQFFMLRGPIWHASWWEYHGVMLAGFLAPVGGLLWQYRTAGDLGAIVEGLFLRRAVAGLRAGDPRALTALAVAVSAKDSETGEHVERVGDLTVALGRRLGLPADRLEVLRWAGRLHDLGKLGVPNSILRKPGTLTDTEFKTIQQHAPRGWQVAVRSELLVEAAPLIRAHHERMDGRGYPDGLQGDAIPLEARIIAVADVWDALTCDRPYRKAMSFEQATAILARDAGPHLDPRCVEALFAELGIEAAA